MSTENPAATEETDSLANACWCCGDRHREADLVRLGEHPEVGVCADCARFLHRRAVAAHATGLRRQLHSTGDRIRDGVMARRWHEHPQLGPPLRWLNRHLPW